MKPETAKSCDHRGAFVRVDKCDTCGFSKGQPFDVYECKLYKECSLTPFKRGMHSCSGCPERECEVLGVKPVPLPEKPVLSKQKVVKATVDPKVCTHEPVSHVINKSDVILVRTMCKLCGLSYKYEDGSIEMKIGIRKPENA